MIFRCQGLAPDGSLGCTRAMGHENRGQACKNLTVGAEWCSLCDLWDCEHVDPVSVAESLLAREKSRRETDETIAHIASPAAPPEGRGA